MGNLLAVVRQSAAVVTILDFMPPSGPAGATVTIVGTGFSATPSQNTVTFNGTAATVTASSATQIVTTVPAGATTGPIAVSAPGGSATSTTAFTVIGLPTITGFTPTMGPPGTAVTITGTNFEPAPANDRVTFNITQATVGSATTTALTTSVPSGATSGRISVTTPRGKAVSSTDFFVTPPPYTAADVTATDRIAFGQTKTITLGTPSKIALVLFDATATQRMSLNLTDSTIGPSWVSVLKPDGTKLATMVVFSGAFVDATVLPATGTYTIVIEPLGTSTGSMTLSLYDVVDVTGPITPGGAPVTVNLTTPGQNAQLTFSGTADHRVSLKQTNVTILSSTVTILNPDGSPLASPGLIWDFIDATVLPTTGTYTIKVDPASTYTGSTTLTLYDVPADVTGTISQSAAGPLTVTLTTPGQNALLTFSGDAGERVSLRVIEATTALVWVYLLKPDGTTLDFLGSGPFGAFLDATTLPVTGTYTIRVDPYAYNTGTITLRLFHVIDIASGTAIGGSALPLTTDTPGQNASVVFAGIASQSATVRVMNNAIGLMQVKLLNPDGSTLTSGYFSGGSFDLGAQTLPATGSYTIAIDPFDIRTGSLDVQVTSP